MSESESETSAEFESLMPVCYCGRCYSMVYEDQLRCEDCGALRPGDGFPNVEYSLDPWLGRIIGDRYFVTKRIGRGGTGSVYRVNTMPFGRVLAIKIVDFANLPADSPVETLERRLEREINALLRLHSPHIVQLYEVMHLPDNVVGVVMDYIHGLTLTEIINESGPMRPKRALKILRQAAEGVNTAHEFGMIHRDIKPDNIMVETFKHGEDFALILDFGVVRIDDGLRLTQGFLGTPLYASPEQATAREVDKRTDIYSLGAVLFFLLTGTPIFQYESIFEILQAHAQAKVPTLRERTHIAFSDEVEALVHKMLAKEPDDRPSSLVDVIQSIDFILRSEDRVRTHRITETSPSVDSDCTVGAKLLKNLEELSSNADNNVRTKTIDIPPDPVKTTSVPQERIPEVRYAVEHVDTNSVIDTKILEHSPWFQTEIVRLFNKLEPSRLMGISGSQSGRSIALLMDDGKILDLAWSGMLTTTPQSNNKEATQIILRTQESGLIDAFSFFNSETEYIIGTKGGLIYSFSKVEKEPPEVIFEHPDGASLEKLAESSSKFNRRVAAFDNGDIYLYSDEATHGKNQEVQFDANGWSKILTAESFQNLAMTHTGESFAIVDTTSGVRIYSFGTPKKPFANSPVYGEVEDAVFSPDGHVLALLRNDGVIELRHTISAAKITSLHDVGYNLCHVSFGSNGGLIGYFIDNNDLYALDLQRATMRST